MSSVAGPSPELSRAVAVAVVKKVFDQAKSQGDAAVKMIQSAAKASQARPSGHSGSLDVIA
ncbi:MAG: hypothetical protein D6695_09670 [Planctomycetota bacterium]|nr:MAG: hypothetical protein D6695_09670 [Planctomycetota bacterium]